MKAVGWLHAHLLLDKIKILLIVLLSFFSSPWPISPCNVSQALGTLFSTPSHPQLSFSWLYGCAQFLFFHAASVSILVVLISPLFLTYQLTAH